MPGCGAAGVSGGGEERLKIASRVFTRKHLLGLILYWPGMVVSGFADGRQKKVCTSAR